MKIEFCPIRREGYGEPIAGELVPDLAPHMLGAFVVHRNPDLCVMPWDKWRVSHAESGASVPRSDAPTKSAAIAAARLILSGYSNDELFRVMDKLPVHP